MKRFIIIFSWLGIVWVLPSGVFAHANHNSANVDGGQILHVPAEIGTVFSSDFLSDLNNSTSDTIKSQEWETQEVIVARNRARVEQEQIRSVVKLVITALLMVLVAVASVWPNFLRGVGLRAFRRYNLISGGAMLSLLTLIIITGVVMSLQYMPFSGLAYTSVQTMSESWLFGYIRNMHYWASDLLVIVLLLHITRVIVVGLADRSQRMAYWGGAMILISIFTTLLFGTFLRSDQEAYEAYAHFWVGTQAYLPQVLVQVIQYIGVGDSALMRFFVLHALFVPLLFAILLGVHALFAKSFRGLIMQVMMSMQQIGQRKAVRASVPDDADRDNADERVPIQRKRRSAQLGILFNVSAGLWITVFALAALSAPLLDPAYNGLEITKPPWYLLWIYGLENIWGMPAIVFGPLIGFGLFISLPLLMLKFPKSRMPAWLFGIGMSGIFVMSMYAALSQPMSHIM